MEKYKMSNPAILRYADCAVEVELDPTGNSGAFSRICGATSAEISISNQIVSTKVADCTDITKPIQTLKSYGGQDVTLTLEASWVRESFMALYSWAKEQKSLKVRLRFPNVAAGKIETITGLALLESESISGIASTDQETVMSASLSLQISGGLTEVVKT